VTPVGVGLIGLGRWGTNYARTLAALPGCRLKAAADCSDAARARAAQEFGLECHASADGLLTDPEVGAVVIATPDHTHYDLVRLALSRGRDVLVEKPMALRLDEAETIAAQAAETGRMLAVGHTAVYDPAFATLRQRVKSLPLDTVKRISAIRASSGYAGNQRITHVESPVANRQSSILLDLSPHDLAMAILLLGVPTSARAQGRAGAVDYELRFNNGALLAGHAAWREPPHERMFQVICDDGCPLACAALSIGALRAQGVSSTPLGRQCADFIESCRTRRAPLSDARLGLHVARCLSALVTSSADGCSWIPLPARRSPSTDSSRRTP
jgi:predicted dehydrogenase